LKLNGYLLIVAISILFSLGVLPLGAGARLESGDISAAPAILIYKVDGNWPMNHWANPDCTYPIIYTDTGRAIIKVTIKMPQDVYHPATFGTLMNAGGYLTSVSYKANWLSNKTISVYSGDSNSELKFEINNVPVGRQHLEVFASCDVLLFENGFSSTYPVPQSGSQGVTFVVALTGTTPEPTPTPVPPATPTPTPSPVPVLFGLSIKQAVLAAEVIVTSAAVAVIIFVILRKRMRKSQHG
jgi:hypothetical protein